MNRKEAEGVLLPHFGGQRPKVLSLSSLSAFARLTDDPTSTARKPSSQTAIASPPLSQQHDIKYEDVNSLGGVNRGGGESVPALSTSAPLMRDGRDSAPLAYVESAAHFVLIRAAAQARVARERMPPLLNAQNEKSF